jgi:hypothetical protein
MRAFTANAGLIAGFVACVWAGSMIDNRVRPQIACRGVPTYAEMAGQRQVSTLFGEFRASLRDFLWIRVDRYLHGGVSYAREHEPSGVHHDEGGSHPLSCGHSDEDSIIPHKKDDWRGILGDWEREIAPYTAPGHHQHKDPRETLPLFRLMVIADPQFAKAYVIGANIICDTPDRAGEALAFLEEGLAANTESIEIHSEIGRYELYYEGDPEGARSHLQKAIRLGWLQPALSEDEEDAFLQGYHWLVICYAKEGKPAERRAAAEEGLRRFPGDPVLLRAAQ